MDEVFGERIFGVLILLLMAFPALPIPSGGISHVFEVITILLCAEMVLGLKKIWLPQKLKNYELPDVLVTKVLPLLMRRIAWVEKHSRKRGAVIMRNDLFIRFAGLCMMAGTIFAITAIPFSGLDTLPSIGVVLMALSVILNDILFFGAGLVISATGGILNLTVGAAFIVETKRIFRHASNPVKYSVLAALILLLLALILHHLIARKKTKTG